MGNKDLTAILRYLAGFTTDSSLNNSRLIEDNRSTIDLIKD